MGFRVVTAVCAALLSTACARTIEVSGGDCIITDPPDAAVWVWVDGAERIAGDAALAAFYPARALRRRLEGGATLQCRDSGCAITDPAVDDDAFGRAAEKVAQARGLSSSAKATTVKVAFRITGPGRGREWACGEVPPP